MYRPVVDQSFCFLNEDRCAERHAVNAQYRGQLQHREDFLDGDAQFQCLADVATHARGIHVGTGGIDGDGDQFEGLGFQYPFAYRVCGHAEEFFHPLRIQLGQ
ncbi:hypothetical protein D3C76_943190 [compost metagenome]